MDFDYIIVGAGVIGSSTAYHLKMAQPDKRILLLDRNPTAGAGNTAKSAALFRNLFSSPTSRMLAGSSIQYYHTIGDRIGLDPIGYLWLFSESQWDRSRSALEPLDRNQYRYEILDLAGIEDIIKLNPAGDGPFPDVHKAIRCRLCGAVSGMALAQHYAAEFRSLGGDISFGTDITDINLTGRDSCYAPWDCIRISSIRDQTGNIHQAAQYVFATGSWTHDLLAPIGIAPGILPKKRQLFGLTINDPSLLFVKAAPPAVILPAGGVYVKPMLKMNILVVGCADDLGQPYSMSDPDPDPRYFHRAIEPVLAHYFPGLGEYELSLKWAGYYAYHWPDMNPVIETVSNLTWVSGTSGSGIMKADAIGRIAASRLAGRDMAELADGTSFEVSRLSLRSRLVEKEELVI